jgi:hypothetical protein
MSALADEFRTLVTALENEGHALASRFRALFEKAPALEAEAVADAKQVEADAIAAAGPVVAEVEGDAKQLAAEVAADVTGAAATAPDVAPAGPAAPTV